MNVNTLRNKATGFTLIELLAVITVIGLLAGLLLPAIGRALERSKGVSCLQNLRSLGSAMTFYAGDHDGWMPMAGIQQATMVPDLLNYMGQKSKDKARSAWNCPVDRKQQERAVLISTTATPDLQHYYSYGFIDAFLPKCAIDPTCSPIYTQSNYFPIVRSSVARPAISPFLSDAGWWWVVNNSVTFKHQRVQFRHGRPSGMDGMELETRNAFWGALGYDTKGAFREAKASLFFYDGHAVAATYAEYAKILNDFIAAGYSDRSGMTPVPASEFQ